MCEQFCNTRVTSLDLHPKHSDAYLLCSLTGQTSKKTLVADEKLVELEQLDATIRDADAEMKVTTAAYEKSVQDRNGVGLMVVDRNDELSILYQKFNGQEEAIKRGGLCLQPTLSVDMGS